ncbi:glycosyltransferase [Alphaproteobacteria bacterium]|nr:glycosyltransferase [Alphaproteobacteria bacterium]
MTRQTKILCYVDSIDSTFGGPAVSLGVVSKYFHASKCFDFRLVVNNIGYCHYSDDMPVYYFDEISKFGRWTPNLVFANGLWSLKSNKIIKYGKRGGKPVLLHPRGTLMPWSLDQKWLKKKVAWYIYQKSLLNDVDCFLVSSANELEALRNLGFRQPAAVIANPMDFGPELADAKVSTNSVVYMSRLHPGKGIEDLIHAWSRCEANGWFLNIYGDGDTTYVAQLKKLCKSLSVDESVIFYGHVIGDAKYNAMCNADFFVLPSYSENFGLAILEALQMELPVITTTMTPWGSISEADAGRIVKNDVDDLTFALQELIRMPEQQRFAMGKRAKSLAAMYSSDNSLEKYQELFCWLTKTCAKPSFVDCVYGVD